MAGEPVIPPPLDDDDDDVAWALQTAQVQWNRGAHSDAVTWLHRAVDAAIATGNFQRTKQLNRLAAAVAARAEQSETPQFEQAPAQAEPPPRAPMETLSGQIPIDIDEADAAPQPQEDGEDDLPTIPPSPWHEGREDSVVTSVAPGTVPGDNPFVDALVGDEPARDVLGLVEPPVPEIEEASPRSIPMTADDLEPDSLREGNVRRELQSIPVTADDLEPEPTEAGSPAGPEPPLPDTFAPEGLPAPESAAPEGVPAPESAAPESGGDTEPEPSNEGVPVVEGISLESVRGFEDLPPEAQRALARAARVETLGTEEEVGAFAAALVTRGTVGIMPSIADVAGGFASAGDVVFTQGSLKDGISLRVVALEDDTRVAVWDSAALEAATADCPWVADELREVADRFQALGGATLGLLGERLDDGLRSTVTERLEVQRLLPGDRVVEAGAAVPGLCVVGAGRIELVDGEVVRDELGPGDFLFATEILSAGSAPLTARAGSSGALLLRAPRAAAHELMLSVPPLLEILAG